MAGNLIIPHAEWQTRKNGNGKRRIKIIHARTHHRSGRTIAMPQLSPLSMLSFPGRKTADLPCLTADTVTVISGNAKSSREKIIDFPSSCDQGL